MTKKVLKINKLKLPIKKRSQNPNNWTIIHCPEDSKDAQKKRPPDRAGGHMAEGYSAIRKKFQFAGIAPSWTISPSALVVCHSAQTLPFFTSRMNCPVPMTRFPVAGTP